MPIGIKGSTLKPEQTKGLMAVKWRYRNTWTVDTTEKIERTLYGESYLTRPAPTQEEP